MEADELARFPGSEADGCSPFPVANKLTCRLLACHCCSIGHVTVAVCFILIGGDNADNVYVDGRIVATAMTCC